jgi:hypothetical protein
MIKAVRKHVSDYLEVVASQAAIAEGIENMSFSAMERPAAEGVPGPAAHREVGVALAAAIARLLG